MSGGVVITEFAGGEVPCPCGKTVRLWYNGGELDLQRCSCGRLYRTRHVSTVLVAEGLTEAEVRRLTEQMEGR